MALRPGCAAFQSLTAWRSRSSNSWVQRSMIRWTGERGASIVCLLLLVVPGRLAFVQKCGEALVRVMGAHQAIEIQLLDLGQPPAHVMAHLAAHGGQREAECGGAA